MMRAATNGRGARNIAPAGWVAWAAMVAALTLPWLLQFGAPEEPVLWWASRAFGFVSYVALWAAMLMGLLVSAQGLGGWLDRKMLAELHEQWTLAGVLATAVHIAAVVTNEHAGIDVVGAVVPFASTRLTAPLALGVIALWAFALVVATSWMRTRMPYAAWRALHALTFGAFVLALVHSVTAGTDSNEAFARWLYVVSGAALAGATVTRVLVACGRGLRRRTPGGRERTVRFSCRAGGAR